MRVLPALLLIAGLTLGASPVRAFEGYVFDAMVTVTPALCEQLGARCREDEAGNPVMLRMRPDRDISAFETAATRRDAALMVPEGYVLSAYVPVSQPLCDALPYQCIPHEGAFLIPRWDVDPALRARQLAAQQAAAQAAREESAAQIVCDAVNGGGIEGFLAQGGVIAQEALIDAVEVLSDAADGQMPASRDSVRIDGSQDLDRYLQGLNRRGINRLCR